jgi:superfamily II DNA or RNA helicase
MLELRSYQEEALSLLRKGFANGAKAQILVAPTGAGKTEMAIALMKAVKEKGNRAAMLLDRIVLCNQTSGRLEKYGIDHGVLQSGHWRYRPYEPIQVCSAQTLEKRGEFPGLDLLIIDEAHQTRKATIDFIKANPNIRVIGLTATPFTRGLGKVYDNVVSPVTTKQLVDEKLLVPLRVFIAKEIDMSGAKKVAGEWSQLEATRRGIKITGDVVAEWIKKTHEIFGRPRKTIVFCAGVDHGVHLSREFANRGYNFVCVSYKDDDEWKRQTIEDFSRPDTKIHGLIATDILTKGFDVPDVMIGISARPFSKSLSSHIQQMGRVMRANLNNPTDKPFAVWLDHSGNYLRFQDDWDDVFQDGVNRLDDGREKSKSEPSEREKKESKCQRCGALWIEGNDACHHCGFVREKQNAIIRVDGRMEELVANAGASRESKQKFWNQMVWYQRYKGWSSGRAAHTYREQFGVWPRGLSNDMPQMPTVETMRLVEKQLKKFLKSIGRR